ncbi:MAG: VCBS repeat-containing protein [Phycisphaerales bacterium]|nr:VCBS repeat-containing protein [Phycisphaerales bacterium]
MSSYRSLAAAFFLAVGLAFGAGSAAAQCEHPWFPHRAVPDTFDLQTALDLNGRGLLELVGLRTDTHRLELVTFDDAPQPTGTVLFASDVGLALAAADFDGDGDADLMIHRPSAGALRILFNDAGTLVEGPDIDAPDGYICATDFDTDGDQDIALASNGLVSVYLNDGAAGFAAGPSIPLGEFALGVHPAALDADGRPDLIAYLSVAGVATAFPVRQTVAGQLEAGPGVAARLRAVGDADADGYTDIVALPVNLHRGNGAGGFLGPAQIAPGYDEAKHLADLDHDGDPDLIANTLDGDLRVLANNGSGAFTEMPGDVGRDPAWGPVITPDMDGDGNPDLVTGRYAGTDIWTGNGDGTFAGNPPVPLFGGQIRRIACADLDGDGDTDVIAVGDPVMNGSQRSLVALANNGDGVLTQFAGTALPAADYLETPVLADLDADGDPDAALIVNDQVVILENTPADPFTTTHTLAYEFDADPGLVLFGTDLNNDGLTDLVAPGRDGPLGGVRIFLNDGGLAFTPSLAPTTNGYDTVLAAADFDRDGNADVLLGDSGRGPIAICFGNGDGTLTPRFLYENTNYDFSHGYTADLNADDAPDLVLQEVARDRFYVLLNDGFGGLYASQNHRGYNQARGIGVGDLNGDGPDDLAVGQALVYDAAGVFLADTTGHLDEPIPFTTGLVELRGTQIADMNGDGAGDIVIAGNASQYGGGAVAISMNPCTPPPCPADFNHDGAVNTSDFVAFLNAWAHQRNQDCTGGGCSADFNDDGQVDTSDFVAFLNTWAQGC